jgi:predicted nucleic acid-binding protein
MATSPRKRVCWDACTWIAFIQYEKILDENGKVIENRYGMCRSVIDLAEGKEKKIEIAVSGLCLVEVCKHPAIKDGSNDTVATYMDADHILVVPVDRQVGMKARELMMAGHPSLRPQDATHLATALIADVDELHTFDKDLLKLNGICTKADGTVLTICKPSTGGTVPPLLAIVSNSRAGAQK